MSPTRGHQGETRRADDTVAVGETLRGRCRILGDLSQAVPAGEQHGAADLLIRSAEIIEREFGDLDGPRWRLRRRHGP